MLEAPQVEAAAAHEANDKGDDKALDELLHKCISHPKNQDRERAVKAFAAAKRSELLLSVRATEEQDPSTKLDAQSRDNAMRMLGRSEFDKLPLEEQWDFALTPLRREVDKGFRGRFAAEQECLGVGDPAHPAAEAELGGVADPVPSLESEQSSPKDGAYSKSSSGCYFMSFVRGSS